MSRPFFQARTLRRPSTGEVHWERSLLQRCEECRHKFLRFFHIRGMRSIRYNHLAIFTTLGLIALQDVPGLADHRLGRVDLRARPSGDP